MAPFDKFYDLHKIYFTKELSKHAFLYRVMSCDIKFV